MAKGPLTVLAYSQDDKTKLDEGKLGLVDNEILQTTGTIRLKAEFSQHGASALAGRADQCAAAPRDPAERPDRSRVRRCSRARTALTSM